MQQQEGSLTVATFSRQRHSRVRSSATNIFIPSEAAAIELKKATRIKQFAAQAQTEDGRTIVFAPSEFSANAQDRADPYATVTIEDASDRWMQKNGFVTSETNMESAVGEAMIFLVQGVQCTSPRLYSRKVPLTMSH